MSLYSLSHHDNTMHATFVPLTLVSRSKTRDSARGALRSNHGTRNGVSADSILHIDEDGVAGVVDYSLPADWKREDGGREVIVEDGVGEEIEDGGHGGSKR